MKQAIIIHSEKGVASILSFKYFVRRWSRAKEDFKYYIKKRHRYGNPDKEGKKRDKMPVVEENHVGADFTKLEYGVSRRLLDAPELVLGYYADVAGHVPDGATSYESKGLETLDIGNGDLPPEWELHVVTYRAVINYGPWADRQRYGTVIYEKNHAEYAIVYNYNVFSFHRHSKMSSQRRVLSRAIYGHVHA